MDAHNTLRNFVASGNEKRGKPGPQPPAANMRALEWNSELTLVAERWAAQCLYANDICRDLGIMCTAHHTTWYYSREPTKKMMFLDASGHSGALLIALFKFVALICDYRHQTINFISLI